MSPFVILAVLCGALLHASWNAAIKGAPNNVPDDVPDGIPNNVPNNVPENVPDKRFNTGLVAAGAGFAAMVLLPFLPAPAPGSLSFIVGSGILQAAYYFILAAVYGVLDMSQAYPIMRGTAPFLVALASFPLLGERLPFAGWCGVLLISVGVVAIAFSGKTRLPAPAALGAALLNAVIIATYTFVDSAGARRSGEPLTYAAWVFFLSALPMVLWLAIRAPGFVLYARRNWYVGALGGTACLLSYGIALWAMTKAPVATVAALRESSILFATGISGLILREKVGWRRAVAAGVIAAGVAVMRFG